MIWLVLSPSVWWTIWGLSLYGMIELVEHTHREHPTPDEHIHHTNTPSANITTRTPITTPISAPCDKELDRGSLGCGSSSKSAVDDISRPVDEDNDSREEVDERKIGKMMLTIAAACCGTTTPRVDVEAVKAVPLLSLSVNTVAAPRALIDGTVDPPWLGSSGLAFVTLPRIVVETGMDWRMSNRRRFEVAPTLTMINGSIEMAGSS